MITVMNDIPIPLNISYCNVKYHYVSIIKQWIWLVIKKRPLNLLILEGIRTLRLEQLIR